MKNTALDRLIAQLRKDLEIKIVVNTTPAQIEVFENLLHHANLAQSLNRSEQADKFMAILERIIMEIHYLGAPGKLWRSLPRLRSLAGIDMATGSQILSESYSKVSEVSAYDNLNRAATQLLRIKERGRICE